MEFKLGDTIVGISSPYNKGYIGDTSPYHLAYVMVFPNNKAFKRVVIIPGSYKHCRIVLLEKF